MGGGTTWASAPLLAEIVGIQQGQVTLMPYGTAHGLSVGSVVVALGNRRASASGMR